MFEYLYSTTRYLVFPSWEASVTTLITAVPPPQKVRNWKRVTDAGNDTEFASIKLQAVALFLIGIDFYGIGTSDLIGQHFAISREAGALDLHCRIAQPGADQRPATVKERLSLPITSSANISDVFHQGGLSRHAAASALC